MISSHKGYVIPLDNTVSQQVCLRFFSKMLQWNTLDERNLREKMCIEFAVQVTIRCWKEPVIWQPQSSAEGNGAEWQCSVHSFLGSPRNGATNILGVVSHLNKENPSEACPQTSLSYTTPHWNALPWWLYVVPTIILITMTGWWNPLEMTSADDCPTTWIFLMPAELCA